MSDKYSVKYPGAELIAFERKRQVEAKYWSPDHDDRLKGGELAEAAACYAMPEKVRNTDIWDFSVRYRIWPWDEGYWKPTPEDRVGELVKAGALIAAEIDRLQRKDRV